jgi:hypothetical protein
MNEKKRRLSQELLELVLEDEERMRERDEAERASSGDLSEDELKKFDLTTYADD